jgi:hypothetical protein
VETGKYSGFWLIEQIESFSLNWFDLFPAFTVPHARERLALGNRIQSQQRNCSRISREFLTPLHNCTDKEPLPEVAVAGWTLKHNSHEYPIRLKERRCLHRRPQRRFQIAAP